MVIIQTYELDWQKQRVKVWARIGGIDRIMWIPINIVYINPMEARNV